MHTLIRIAALTGTVWALPHVLPGVQVRRETTALKVAVVFFFIPLIVNTAVLWVTDRVIDDFEIATPKALWLSGGAITLVTWVLHVLWRF